MIKNLAGCLTGSLVAAGFLPNSASAQVSYRYYSFEPLSLEASGPAVQLSEFTFSANGERLNLLAQNPDLNPPFANGQNGTLVNTVPVIVTGGTNAATAAEGSVRIVDGDLSTKWLSQLHTNDDAAFFLDFDFLTPVTVDSYSFATGGDTATYPNRNPRSWNIWARNSTAEDWLLIDQITDYAVPAQNTVFTDEFPLTGDLPPVIPVYEVAPGTPAIVLNGDTAELNWMVTSVNPVDSVTLSDGSAETPEETTVNGKVVQPTANADTHYTLTATQGSRSTSRELTVRSVEGGSATYSHYRFTPVATRQSVDGHQLAEFEFFYQGQELNLIASNNPEQSTGSLGNNNNLLPVTVTNPGGSSIPNGSENVIRLVDGDTATKFFDRRTMPVIFAFEAPTPIDSYRFITANDYDRRDPVKWTLEGSNDGNSWTLIDNITSFNYPAPVDRFTESQVFPLPGSSLDSEVEPRLVYQWNGTTDGMFEYRLNWDRAEAPNIGDEIRISSGRAVRSGNLERNGRSYLEGSGALQVNGRFINRNDFFVSGGSLQVNGEYFLAGNSRMIGSIQQSAGTVSATISRGWFLSDDGDSGGSSYRLSGTGVLNVTNTGNGNTAEGGNALYNAFLGKGGSGDLFEITGGTANFTSTGNAYVNLARGATFRVQGGTTNIVDYVGLLLGYEGSGDNRLEVSGGTLNLSSTALIVGRDQNGIVTLSGGNLNVDSTVDIGTGNGTGVFTMTGGELVANDISAGVNGVFNFEGGTILLDGNRTSIIDEVWFSAIEGTTATYEANQDVTRISLESSGTSEFVQWIAGFDLPVELQGAAADADGDGYSNLFEFAFGGDPSDPEIGGLSTGVMVEGETALTLAVRAGAEFTSQGGRLVAVIDGIRYEIQGSIDLADWDVQVVELETAATSGVVFAEGEWTLHSFMLSEPSAEGRAFLRAEVTEAP